MKTLLIPEELRDHIVAYLMERPYKEVAAGIVRMQTLPEAPPAPSPPAPPPEEKKKG